MGWKQIVGANIRSCRSELGLSQEELAHRAALTPSYIGQVERAVRNISIEALGRIADALGVPMERLVRRG
jgi:transcriptional regulator with XRE-family HTH domain